jgi:hypothetical protein
VKWGENWITILCRGHFGGFRVNETLWTWDRGEAKCRGIVAEKRLVNGAERPGGGNSFHIRRAKGFFILIASAITAREPSKVSPNVMI